MADGNCLAFLIAGVTMLATGFGNHLNLLGTTVIFIALGIVVGINFSQCDHHTAIAKSKQKVKL